MAKLEGRYAEFFELVKSKVDPTRIYTDALHTFAYGTDAGFYRLVPKVVIKAINEVEIQQIIKLANNLELPLCFRAAGSSLSGQAITDSILVSCNFGWNWYDVKEDGRKITVEPSLTGGQINAVLKPYGTKFGPDPATINTAKVVGILANNASGMACGVDYNSYETIDSMRIILSDGTLVDTGDPASRAAFEKSHAEMLSQLKSLSDEVKANQKLHDMIAHKYKIKNVTGFGLNSLVDRDDPIDMLQQLMVGSEGALGFISQMTFDTVEDKVCKQATMMLFPSIQECCRAVAILRKAKPLVATAELLDRAAIRAVEDMDGIPSFYKELPDGATGLLVQVEDDTQEKVLERAAKVKELVSSLEMLRPMNYAIDDGTHCNLEEGPCGENFDFTADNSEIANLWKVRKGVFPACGSMRPKGTACVIEDIACEVDKLGDMLTSLIELFKKYSFDESVIYGHALDGNVHFIVAPNFNDPEDVVRFETFMSEVNHMVVEQYDGSLKAEHGTGRNMAPFVKLEWGEEAYDVMARLKNIIDPVNLFNPGVIINDDPHCHTKNLKAMRPVHDLVDKCIECGFCELSCPSKELTLTPRQRITISRELSRLRATGEDIETLKELESLWEYDGETTCAADGMCGVACPVGIDTGKYIKHLRNESWGDKAKKNAHRFNTNFSTIVKATRFALSANAVVQRVIGKKAFSYIMSGARKNLGDWVPYWASCLPVGVPFPPAPKKVSDKKVVYFSTCASRTMGPALEDPETRPIYQVYVELMEKAGYQVIYPDNLDELCCGQPWESNGFNEEALKKTLQLEAALMKASEDGKWPIVCDATPCVKRTLDNIDNKAIKMYEPVGFAEEYLLPNLNVTKRPGKATVWATCTTKKMSRDKGLENIARACIEEVIVPQDINCCGFAGSRGFFVPELNQSAVGNLKFQVEAAEEAYSTSRTCEIGISDYTGKHYKSIYYLLNDCSTARV